MDYPQHITKDSDDRGITVSSGWFTHGHYHNHPAGRLAFDGRPINHTKSVNHRHEHCWTPQERHHHPVDPAVPSRPRQADHDNAHHDPER